MAPQWHQGTIAPRALQNNLKVWWKNQVHLRFEGVLRAEGPERMREALEMVAALLM